MIGKASDAKRIRVLTWIDVNTVEVHTAPARAFSDGDKLRLVWRIVHHPDKSQYEVRRDEGTGRFTRLWDYFPSLDAALCEIEAVEADANEDAELLRER
jgi:hypothetical protein